MIEENGNNLDELTESLLKKCEVSNLAQFYFKCVEEYEHSALVNNICAIHKNFNEKKVLKDTCTIPELLVVEILDYSKKNNKNLKKSKYVIDTIGLSKILRALKRKGILKKLTNIKQVCLKLGIEEKRSEKTLELVKKAISEKILRANLQEFKKKGEPSGFNLEFHGKFIDPKYRGDAIKLIITLIILIVFLSIFIPIMYNINTNI